MNIPVLADTTHQIAKDYGVLKEDEGIAFRGMTFFLKFSWKLIRTRVLINFCTDKPFSLKWTMDRNC